MSSEKTERLINLTLGLLASKRYLTKNEIFRTISGYSGTPESMERMFERDKDELRSAGIVIEVGGLDPLFEGGVDAIYTTDSFEQTDPRVEIIHKFFPTEQEMHFLKHS